jgi:3-isopropylmalate dehydratase small subunit
MQPFTIFEACAAPLPDADIDTDILFPARFLVLTQKKGLGRYALHDQRYDANGAERPDFVLNRPPWRAAGILVTGPNFGCGSSREQAPWALADLGIRCMIGPSFGAIFEANCHRNGLLPVRVGPADHQRLMARAEAAGSIRVDLRTCLIDDHCGDPIAFEVPDTVRTALLEGTDEIARILRDDGARIAAFEARQRQRMPWLYDSPT